MTLKWKKHKIPTGLTAVRWAAGHGNRGSDLLKNGVKIATISYVDNRFHDNVGWYFCCPTDEELGIELKNTASALVETEKEAKKLARDHIEACIRVEIQAGLLADIN